MRIQLFDTTSRVGESRTDRGVSPVIGIILLVAITVILAAVVGIFALGLGDQIAEPTPTNTLEIEQANGEDELTIRHTGGDRFHWEDVIIVIESDEHFERSPAEEMGLNGEFRVGDRVTTDDDVLNAIEDDEDVEISLVHTPSGSTIGSEEFTYSAPPEE